MSVDLEGEIGKIDVGGAVVAEGMNSAAVHVCGHAGGLDDVSIRANDGEGIVQTA